MRRVKDNAPYHGRADCPQSAAECERWYAKYPVLRRYDEAFRKVVREMRETKVEGDTPAVWYVYNMGVIVKTRKGSGTHVSRPTRTIGVAIPGRADSEFFAAILDAPLVVRKSTKKKGLRSGL